MSSKESETTMGEVEEYEWKSYLIVHARKAGFLDLWRFWRSGDEESGSKFINKSSHDDDYDEYDDGDELRKKDKRWVIVVSVIVRKLLALFHTPMEWTGFLVEFFLNLLSLNGNLIGLFFNLLQGKVVLPHRGSATFRSAIGFLDQRANLYKADNFGVKLSMGNRSLMDLCIMASKLAYENANVVEDVVVNHWKMHFVGFYKGWNDYQKDLDTQVCILCEKPIDANLILISFGGTELFDAYEWSTDFDYSWYEIPNIGKVHVGFLEALGLGSRTNVSSFQQNFQVKDNNVNSKLTAYDAVKTKLKELLAEHKNAKFVVTGHSLGGALAIMLLIVFVLNEEKEVMDRLLGVCTFGQPRVGDAKLGRFMEKLLNQPEPRYFRFVYCNDIVPRLPYDNKAFLYKHFGVCLYYNSFYVEQKVEEEPNRNYFDLRYLIPAHLNAVWELIRGLTMPYLHGSDYKEDWFTILFRLIGLLVPGIPAHSPREYINSVRLGRQQTVLMSSLG